MSLKDFIRAKLSSSLVKFAFYNYALHFSRFILPLVVMPYLSRVLGPEAYGQVFLTTSFGMMLTLVVEFGFSLSATRELAKHRESPEQIEIILSNVFGAKCMLAGVALVIGILAVLTVPKLSHGVSFAWMGLPFAIAFGMSPMWYYQAIEKMRVQSMLEIGGQFLAMMFVFLLVSGSGDAIYVPILQTCGAAIATCGGYRILYRSTRFIAPSVAGSIAAIKLGWTMFVFRSFVMLYTTANVFLVGLLLPVSQVAFYGTAEKLFSALTGLFGPFAQTVFPRMNYLLKADPHKAIRLAKTGMGLVVGASLLAVIGAFVLTPYVIPMLFGANFAPSVPLFEVMILALPFIGASQILGIQCLLPLHMDKAFNIIICSAGILNITLGVTSIPVYGAEAMAWSRVVAEAAVSCAMAGYLWGRRGVIMNKILGIS